MCGIACTYNIDKINTKNIHKSMRHRGPDDENFYRDNNLLIFHNRLSIQDLSSNASQPMKYKEYVIAFNGEIYNHISKRKLLNEFTFKSTSDTETLLYLFIKFGENCLQHLDGMFSFIIYNTITKKLFFARDRAGKKPLYIYKNNSRLFLASEIRTIIQNIPCEINSENINSFLRSGFFYKDKTPLLNVVELESGSFGFYDTIQNKIKIQKWWNISNFYNINKTELNENEIIENLEFHLNNSVKRRLLSSDLEVGSFLSGGIDSGIVSAIASKYTSKLKTFTVSFDGQYDESALSLLVAKKYGLDHKCIKIDYNNLADDVEKIIINYGEPFSDSSAIPSYYISKEAKKYLTVILNGDGGDELFGGYRRYVPFRYFDFFKSNIFRKLLSQTFSKIFPMPDKKISSYSYIYRLMSILGKDDHLQIYLSSTTDIFEDYCDILKNDLQGFNKFNEDINKIISGSTSSLDAIMNIDFEALLFGDLLVKMDIATMANSLEGRSPFLSKELLEFAPQLPNSFKVNKFKTKYILRKLAKRYLPNEILNQPKRGFEVPLKFWVDNQLNEVISDYLSAPKISNDYLNSSFISNLLANKMSIPSQKRAKMIWNIFSLEVWYKYYQTSQAKIER